MKRYAICGVSNRAIKMYIEPMVNLYGDHCRPVGLLDPDPRRFEACRAACPQTRTTPVYGLEEFDLMVAETKPDAIIVAGTDNTHADYIVKALSCGLEVIVEKPMATTSADCRRVMEAERQSKGRVIVAFNYRYMPVHTCIKELLIEERIGRVTAIDLNWSIDTYHGASYFKRWNRLRRMSGGLSVHKSSHHFDLVHWWLGQAPVEVFAYGALHHYGPHGELNPVVREGRHCETCDDKPHCAYYMRWSSRSEASLPPDDHLGTLREGRHVVNYSGYRPDACIFDAEIDIEDTYSAIVQYEGGALLSYSISFSAPYEGYRLAISGTKGRIETTQYLAPARLPYPAPASTIDVIPLFGAKETIYPLRRAGGHGGGDPLLLEDLFLGDDPARNYEIASDARAGAYAVATGEAVWRSVKENRPMRLAELLGGSERSEP